MPKDQAPGMRFVANLRSRTIEAFGQHGIQPDAYLLSTHRINPAALEHAHAQRDRGVPLVADNGTKELIDGIRADFRDAARSIWHRVREVRHTVGRTPRGQDVPEALRRDASELAREVVQTATRRSEAIDVDDLIEAQLSMRPTHLVAQEDFAVACLLSLNLEREITGWRVESIARRNRRSLELWQRVSSDPRIDPEQTVFAVLAGTDYNTARVAGRLAADAGAEHVAVGCAGFMLDRTSIDFFTVSTANFRLERPVPRRYVRFVQVMTGIRDGFAERGRPLRSLHALGLGAPALFPVFVAAMPTETALTTDATSPIHDAVRDRVLYDPVGHGGRLTLHAIVDRLIRGEDWPFACPFCRHFRDEHGHDPERARHLWEAAGRPNVNLDWLDGDDPAAALPLFADPERRARPTHVAHNHWVVGKLCREVPAGSERVEWAMDRIGSLREGVSLTVDRGLGASLEILEEVAGG